MKLVLLAIALPCIALVACQSQPQLSPTAAAALNQPIICHDGADCAIRWGRALTWVTDNSAYRIDQATDSLISTWGPLPDDLRPAFTITKTAQGNGVYLIEFAAGCGNYFGCEPSLAQAKASFMSFVTAPLTPPKVALGLVAIPTTPQLAAAHGLTPPRGLFVTTVSAGGPAARAGIVPGDIITAIDGKTVDLDQEAKEVVAKIAPGQAVPVALWRDGAPTTVTVQF
ncbi:MAG TPA: PDZ domain-containing protein [Alphaproteobacteria bacterium]|nr:PDZ domain-containing protein [Alphaproteobacteria bacterium]